MDYTSDSGCTFEDVADWAAPDLLILGVQDSTAQANQERCRRAASILAEYALYPEEFDEPPMLRLLVKHHGDMVAVADDLAMVEHLREHLRMDGFLVQVWQDLERTSAHPAGAGRGAAAVLGARLTEAVNEVRARAGLRRLTTRQVATRRLGDVVRVAASDTDRPRGRHHADHEDKQPAARYLAAFKV
ncbi:hypothetical protein [Luteipulveratus mongoliensis]|uniref:Uncharacterized protein n=1 Tax=Luteipulveratus mongoliensis TaxID=571913 RepID=A0A0K1JEW6_9MICO|nr:hypothetical protein [Luteipulveratus mongoliensis]AKU15138.1 hypothetical protein VV02_03430 [Luteipulveratus mongoliensis]